MNPNIFILVVWTSLEIAFILILRALLHYKNVKDNLIWIYSIGILISIPFLYRLSKLIWIYSLFFYLPSNFTKEKWNLQIDKRFEMANVLIYGSYLNQKSKNYVQENLGIPESIRYDSIWIYNLGTRPGEIDPDFLEIYFKNNTTFKIVKVCEGKGKCEENEF
ncbi:MAG: hypothetical protein WBO44_13055 [Saprospiraceae bacterium]